MTVLARVLTLAWLAVVGRQGPLPAWLAVVACVTTDTRHLDRLGKRGEFEQESNTDSGAAVQHVYSCAHIARRKAHVPVRAGVLTTEMQPSQLSKCQEKLVAKCTACQDRPQRHVLVAICL